MFIIEGNIGAGKSSLLKVIKERLPHLEVVFEPVNQWHSGKNGQSLLTDFYENPERWAYTFETFAMVCRVKEYIKESSEEKITKIMERSIFSGHYCFAKNDYINGFMNDIEWETYQTWFTFLTSNKVRIPDGFIYLKVDPKVALERIAKRNRSGENNISIKYLEDINKRHDEFLLEKNGLIKQVENVPVLALDCNYDFEKDKQYLDKVIYKISEFTDSYKNLPQKEKAERY